MRFTVYGNCQADVLANLLMQSPEFAKRYELARLRPCFNVSQEEIEDWVSGSAPDVNLFVSQKLRKGWRGSIDVFDTDWLENKCAPGVKRFEWSDMYYSAYEPHMAYPITFPRLQPADYVNLLHLMTFANGLEWRNIDVFYRDADIFSEEMVRQAHAASIAELSRREVDCTLKVSPFIAEHWHEERLFFTFNHPGRRVVVTAANQIITGLGLSENVPTGGYFGFLSSSALPSLASFDAILNRPERRSMEDSFFLNTGVVPATQYFERWEASLGEVGREKVRLELAAQANESRVKFDLLHKAAQHLSIVDPW